MKREFTGRHMVIVLVSGFGVVIAVNLLMASFAVSSFGGVVVENSYVASQNFNDWLDQAERSEALGWQAQIGRGDDGGLSVATSGVPEAAQITAELRRPLGTPEDMALSFSQITQDQFLSVETVPQGRWIVRLNIAADGQNWSVEEQIQ